MRTIYGTSPLLLVEVGLIVFLCQSAARSVPEDALPPKLKWGQGKDKIFLSAVVKDLDRSTVKFTFGEGEVEFEAADIEGRKYAIHFELWHDLQPEACHWEHVSRPIAAGDVVLATLVKKYPDRWEDLAYAAAMYRQIIEKDWTREDQKLEPSERDPFFEAHERYLELRSSTAMGSDRTVVLLLRHKGCRECSVVDDTFAKVASTLMKKRKRGKLGWRTNMSLGVVDVRSHRLLARRLNGSCARTPVECRLHAIVAGVDEPVHFRGRQDEQKVWADLQALHREQFLSAGRAAAQREGDGRIRALAVFASDEKAVARRIAHHLILRMDIAVPANESEAEELGFNNESDPSGLPLVKVWPPGETEPMSFFRGEPLDTLTGWLRARGIPILGEPVTFEDNEPYEELQLPVIRLFLEGNATIDAVARATLREVALLFLGRAAFMVRNATLKKYEWMQHGLPPGRFPSLGVGLNMQHNTTRFGFLSPPKNASAAYWAAEETRHAIITFIDDALAGRLSPSIMSEDPDEEDVARPGQPSRASDSNWTVLKLVGRTCKEVLENSETDLLIEGFDEWRRDHKKRTLQLDHLSLLLRPINVSIYRFDFGQNQCPLIDPIPAGYSSYFFVARHLGKRGLKVRRMGKWDPSFDRVLQFLAKHAEVPIDINATFAQLESIVAAQERWEKVAEIPAYWRSLGAGVATLLAMIAGAIHIRRRNAPVVQGCPLPPSATAATER